MMRKRHDRGYVSDFTRFITGYLDRHPEAVADQRVGRALYWDKPVDLTALREAEEDHVPADAYYYFGDPTRR